jgi:glc operon protein GlcG
MLKRILIVVLVLDASCFAQLPSRKYLDLAAVKTMVTASEAEAQKRQVHVTICVVDDHGNLLFLEKGDGVPVNTVDFARLKARHAALYGAPSKNGADMVKNGSVEAITFPDFFPNQGGVPIIVDGQVLGGISASGAKSEIDEAIAQAGVDGLLQKVK